MYDREKKLELPKTFNFPFEPYDIQQQFMENLFEVIEGKGIGIFESPTGTGKTLTLTCGAITWLVEHEKAVNDELNVKISDLNKEIRKLEIENGKNSDWISGQYETIQLKQELSKSKADLDALLENQERIKKIRSTNELEKVIKKFVKKQQDLELDLNIDIGDENKIDEFMIDEPDEDYTDDSSEAETFQDCKIYFCSRTHSQLSQVVQEIKRTVFEKDTRVVALASRQNYCINPEVKALKSNTLINERCLELQKNKGQRKTDTDTHGKTVKKSKTSNNKCSFYNSNTIENLKNESVSQIMDIEDLIHVAKEHKACPYYSTRLAAHDSQIIMVPYQMILHQKTRSQLGIDIQGSVLIIDEAHNLMDTIAAIHNIEISLQHIEAVKHWLGAYKQRYLSRFSAKSVLKINQLFYIAKRLISCLKEYGASGESTRMITNSDLMSDAELFDLNIVELCQFAEQTRLAQKVHGFALSEKRKEKVNESVQAKETGLKAYLKQLEEQNPAKKKSDTKTIEENSIPVTKPEEQEKAMVNFMRPFFAFLECLLQDFKDGRILVSTKSGSETMKYLVLNPGAHFNTLVKQCRAIILAGGTMQPITEFTEQLFADCRDRVKVHTFNHVVAQDAVLPLAYGKGPSGKELLFNFANKNNKEMLQELSSTLVNICNVVPAGVVCFFSSYDTLEGFYQYFKENNFLKRVEVKKRVFLERRRGPQSDTILEQYSKAIKILRNNTNTNDFQNGALLLSVVGGKLSEGLNFSDDLGRCVIVIGLPYPNKFNPELIEKMKYLDKNLHSTAGNEYYENLCMKAVNQCIGRAVRHINDYASVVLLDVRYTHERIRKKLPIWIEKGLECVESYGKGQSQLVKFFKEKKR